MAKQNKPRTKSDNLCGAKTRKGTPCKNYAMANGRCRMHGGKSTGPKDASGNKNAVKHGVYETLVTDKLNDDQKKVYEAIPDTEDLREELKILRFKLLRLLEPVEKEVILGGEMGSTIENIEIDEVTKSYAIEKLVDGIRKVVKDMGGTEEDDGSLEALAEALTKSAKMHQQEDGGDDGS